MKVRQRNPINSHSPVNKSPSYMMFWGGLLLGAMSVMLVMSQNQVKHYTLQDGSVLTTATTMTSSMAKVTPPGGIRAAPTNVLPAQSSSSDEDEDEDESQRNTDPSDKDEPDDGDGVEGSAANSGVVSYARANRDSGGFFDDITDSSWALLKQRVKSRTNYYHPNEINKNIDQPHAWYQENFEPDFTCLHERRIGGMGDGPKWVCDPHRLTANNDDKRKCLVYSVGSEGNFMFETAIMKEIGDHCEIHTFDPEIQGRPYGHLAPAGVNYHNWGFMSETDGQEAQVKYYDNVRRFKGNYKTMKQTIDELGHAGKEIDIFKIDCEGCEWTTFRGWFNSGATLRQILVEVHKTPSDTVHDFFLGMQQNGYVTFHKEPNIQFAGGKCVEYAFLKLEDSFFLDD